MTSDNNNIEVSSFSYGGDNDGNSCGSTGQITIPALHSNNSISNSISNSLGGSSIPKKRKSLWKRLLKRGGSKYSEGTTTDSRTHAVPPSNQPNPALFEASFKNPSAGASISTTVDNNSPNNAGPRASSGLPTTTADLLRHRAARRSRSIDRSRSIGGNGGNALSTSEASRSRAHSSNCGRSYAANDGIGQDIKTIIGNDEANAASSTAGHDLRLTVSAPPSPPESGKQQQQQQHHHQLSSSPKTTSSTNHRHHNQTHQQQQQQQQQQRKILDPFFRHPPLSPPHHGISSIRSGIAPSSCGKSVTSKGTGGSTVCRGEQMTLITSTTASMTVSTTPTEGDGSSINPSLRATPTIRMSIGSGKDNRPNHISTNIPRLRTPSTDPPTTRTRRMDSSSPSASSSASSKSNKDHRHPITAVVTPDSIRGRRDPPSSSSSPSSRADSGPAVATVTKMTGMDPDGSKFLHSTTTTTTTTASDWTLHEEDQTAMADILSYDTTTAAGGCSATSASSGQRRRRRQGSNIAVSTGALTTNNAVIKERSTGMGTNNYDSGYDSSGGLGAGGNAATTRHGVGDANNSGDGSTKRDLKRHVSITAVGGGGPSIVTPMQASGKNQHFQVGTTIAAGDEEEIIEEETSSSAISRRKNDSNNINKEGVSLLVVEEVTRYITNPSTNNENNDQGNNNITGTSTRGPRVGKVAMSRFTTGKNKASSAPGIMMPKASKLSRKKKGTPFSRGAGNSGGHDIGSSQEKRPADKNDGSSIPLHPLQEGGGIGIGPKGETVDGGNNKITTSMDTNANTSAAAALDNGKNKTSPRNTTLPPTSIADNNVANKNNDSHLSYRHANSGSAAAAAKNNNAHHPHLYAEINIPVSNKLSKRPSPNKSSASHDGSAIAGEGGGDDVSLAMTSLSSLTGRSSIFGIPATEGGAAGVMGVGINNMYASMIPNTWCNPGGGAGSKVGNRNNSRRLSHPYQEENYFDYDENNEGNLGQAEHYATETENLNSGINGNEEDGIMDRVFCAWNDALKSTCQCFDVATTDDEPLWRGGGDEDAVGGTKSRATENANFKNKDATGADVATQNANLSQQPKASSTNSNNKAVPPPTFSKPMDI